MADLALRTDDATSDKVSVVQSDVQVTAKTNVAIAAGDVICFDATTGRWAKADANAAATSFPLFIALKTAAKGMPLTAIRRGVIEGFVLTALSYGDKLYLSETAAKISDASIGAGEVQTVSLTGVPTGGTFTLTFNGQETSALAYDAAAATVQAALALLTSIEEGNCKVSGSAGGPWVVTFLNALSKSPQPAMTGDGASLTGGTDPAVAVAETNPGASDILIGYVVPRDTSVPGASPDKLLAVECNGNF